MIYALNTTITIFTVTAVGGPYFFLAIIVLGTLYYQAARIYGQASRDMRRLGKRYSRVSDIPMCSDTSIAIDSVTRSPLYSMYGETIAGVTVRSNPFRVLSMLLLNLTSRLYEHSARLLNSCVICISMWTP